MASFYITQAGALALQSAGLPGWLTPKVDLLVNPLPAPPNRLADVADFTKPTYTGYAAQNLVMTGGFVLGAAGPVYSLSGEIRFPGPASGPGASVTGFLITDGATAVYGWGTFDGPINEFLPTDLVALVLALFEDESYQLAVLPA